MEALIEMSKCAIKIKVEPNFGNWQWQMASLLGKSILMFESNEKAERKKRLQKGMGVGNANSETLVL